MTDVNNQADVNSQQAGAAVVDPQDVNVQQNDSQVVNENGVNAQPANVQTEQAIPYNRFKEVNDAKTAAEQRAQQAEQQLLMMQQQILSQQSFQQKQVNTNQPQTYLQRVGVQAGEIPTAEQVNAAMQLQQQDTLAAIQAQQFLASHQDFNSVVGKVNPYTGQPEISETFKKVISKNPAYMPLQYLAFQNPAYAQIAYDMVVMQKQIDDLQGIVQVNNAFNVQQTVQQKTSAMSSQAAGGGAGVNPDSQFSNLNMSNPQDRQKIYALRQQMLAGQFNQT